MFLAELKNTSLENEEQIWQSPKKVLILQSESGSVAQLDRATAF